MKNRILTLIFLPVLSMVPAIAQPPQGGQPGGGARPPVEIDQTPPVEDFKPSALNAIINGR